MLMRGFKLLLKNSWTKRKIIVKTCVSGLTFWTSSVGCKVKQNQKQQNYTQNKKYQTVMELSKSDLMELLLTPSQQCIILVFNRYARKTQHFRTLLRQSSQHCQIIGIPYFYIVQDTQIRHLQKYQQIKINQNLQNISKNDIYYQYIYVNPSYLTSFKLKHFSKPKTDTQQLHFDFKNQVQLIRSLQPTINTTHFAFDHTNIMPHYINVVKKCHNFGQQLEQCIKQYKTAIKQLIEEGAFNKKQSQYRFEINTLGGTLLKPIVSQANKKFNNYVNNVNQNNKSETFVIIKDILGKQIRVMSDLQQQQSKKQTVICINNTPHDYKSKLKSLIQPRLYIISGANFQRDAQQLVKAQIKYPNAVILSYSNHIQPAYWNILNTAMKYYNGQLIQHKIFLDYLKNIRSKYSNEQLLITIINTSMVSELIRHTTMQPYSLWLFKLTNQINYPKLKIGIYRHDLTMSENINLFQNYFNHFRKGQYQQTQIQMDQKVQINLQQLNKLKLAQSRVFIRLCREQCMHNQLYPSYMWIDTQIHRIGLPDGQYLLLNGSLNKLE